jgi:hypothetical protein
VRFFSFPLFLFFLILSDYFSYNLITVKHCLLFFMAKNAS